MKKTGKKQPGKSSQIGDDDKLLWEQVTKTITPLKRTKQREPSIPAPDTQNMQSALEEKTPKPKRKTIQSSPISLPKSKSALENPPSPTNLDQKSAKRLRSGRIEIEARLDLHGMRQSQAHTTLRGFISSAQARGLRWVLVITGKGASKAQRLDTSDSNASEHWIDSEPRERGVLRRSVPQWLSEADLRTYVVGFSKAAPHHGGDGALYIQIRKLKTKK